jgi:hypothetical protein
MLLVLAALLLAPGATALAATSPVILIHHPADRVDPFGVAVGLSDTFASRYLGLEAQTGRFDFPVFVADGVTAIQQLPNATKPFDGTLAAYRGALQERAAHDAPVQLALLARGDGDHATATVAATPRGTVQDPQGQPVHLWLAVTEDAIHYQPPAPVSNGVTDHRFTVRALLDAGPVPLAAWNRTLSIPLDGAWRHDQLTVAAWLQAGPVAGRFEPNEVLQAVSAPLDGVERVQDGRGVLLEAYSATWCAPCLYGDLALERLAIQSGVAQPLAGTGTTYWQPPAQPVLVAGAALAAGAVGAVLARRKA